MRATKDGARSPRKITSAGVGEREAVAGRGKQDVEDSPLATRPMSNADSDSDDCKET